MDNSKASTMINALFRSVVYKSMEQIPDIDEQFGYSTIQQLEDKTVVVDGVRVPVYKVKISKYNLDNTTERYEGTIALTDTGIQYCFEDEKVEHLIKRALEYATPTGGMAARR
jgi:hypothetical protein